MNNEKPHHILLMIETKTPKNKTKEQKMKQTFIMKSKKTKRV
jgi:hypothetical protein